MKLSEAKKGCLYEVESLTSGAGMSAKLTQLGIYPGSQVIVLRQAPLNGPYLIKIGLREIALGRKITERIIVKEVTCASH